MKEMVLLTLALEVVQHLMKVHSNTQSWKTTHCQFVCCACIQRSICCARFYYPSIVLFISRPIDCNCALRSFCCPPVLRTICALELPSSCCVFDNGTMVPGKSSTHVLTMRASFNCFCLWGIPQLGVIKSRVSILLCLKEGQHMCWPFNRQPLNF